MHASRMHQIVTYYREGMKVRSICALTDCSSSQIYRILHEKKIALRGVGKRGAHPDQKATDRVILKAYAEGVTLRKIAALVGNSTRRVYIALDRHGVPRRDPSRVYDARRKRTEGLTPQQQKALGL